jgi:hypothetical protein
MPAVGGHSRLTKPNSALSLHPRVGGRKRLVGGFLHMIENDQADHGQDDGSKASNEKRLHGTLPLRYSFWL